MNLLDKIKKSEFLLTCLLRGMTKNMEIETGLTEFLLTCLLRGMTEEREMVAIKTDISTHMPLARHDYFFYGSKGEQIFLLTCLLRGMTQIRRTA